MSRAITSLAVDQRHGVVDDTTPESQSSSSSHLTCPMINASTLIYLLLLLILCLLTHSQCPQCRVACKGSRQSWLCLPEPTSISGGPRRWIFLSFNCDLSSAIQFSSQESMNVRCGDLQRIDYEVDRRINHFYSPSFLPPLQVRRCHLWNWPWPMRPSSPSWPYHSSGTTPSANH